METGIRLFGTEEHENNLNKIFFRLVAIGANKANRSIYVEEHKNAFRGFEKQPIEQIFMCWDDLDDEVRIKIMNNNMDKFINWMSAQIEIRKEGQ